MSVSECEKLYTYCGIHGLSPQHLLWNIEYRNARVHLFSSSSSRQVGHAGMYEMDRERLSLKNLGCCVVHALHYLLSETQTIRMPEDFLEFF